MRNNFYKNRHFQLLIIFLLVAALTIIAYHRITLRFYPPKVSDKSALLLERKQIDENVYVVGNSWLKKNEFGLWEMYLEGSPFEMGVKNGILTGELGVFQEEAFVAQIRKMIPSERYMRFLKYFIAAFNRNMALHIPKEYRKEIYGVSINASSDFNYISKPYHRIMNYHAAHDIGHALQNMNLVMCTAFGVKGLRSENGKMLLGRNFDLYVGDDFAKNKIITFVNPESGYKFASVSWASMIGVVSGINEKGLTITYNSAKSAIPLSAKMPVSLLARKIIQYASTIDEAYEIAKNHKTFVSGSFMVSSAIDKRMVVIEKTKKGIDIYETLSDELILTNHFQGEKYRYRDLNVQNIIEGSTLYRLKRTKELMDRKDKHNINTFVKILRNQKGLDDEDIGMGNEKAVNQLIAHHSIVFMPEELKFWVSSNPYQLGTYVAYDLNKVFSDSLNILASIFVEELNIPEDEFLYSQEYQNYENYKLETLRIENALKSSRHDLSEKEMLDYLSLNPGYYYPIFLVGEYYRSINNVEKAKMYYNDALSRQIPWKSEQQRIYNAIDKLKHQKN